MHFVNTLAVIFIFSVKNLAMLCFTKAKTSPVYPCRSISLKKSQNS